MRTKNELYQQALRTVAMRRQTARALAQDAQAEAEAAIPGLRHAEEEVRVRGIRCAIAGASGKDRTETAAALAAAKQAGVYSEVSLEQRMGCGVGACVVCACTVIRDGEEKVLRVCKDGPVFSGEEVVL